MKQLNLWKTLFCAMLTIAATAFTACVDDDVDKQAPMLELSEETVAFTGTATEDATVTVKSNRQWTVAYEDEETQKEWMYFKVSGNEISEGVYNGDGTVKITVGESAQPHMGRLVFTLSNTYGELYRKYLTVTQGNYVPPTKGAVGKLVEYILGDSRLSGAVGSDNAMPLQYSETTIEAVILANDAAGNNNRKLYVGDNNGLEKSAIVLYGADFAMSNDPATKYPAGRKVTLNLENANYYAFNNVRQLTDVVVTVSEDKVDLVIPSLSVEKFNSGEYQAQYVKLNNMTPQSSWVGKSWTVESSPQSVILNDAAGKPLTVYMNQGRYATGFADMYIADKTGTIYGVAETYRESAQLIPTKKADIEALSDGGGPGPGPEPGNAIYYESFGTVDVSAKPLISDYTGWAKTGSGAGEVSYTGEGKVSIRTTGKPSAGYEGASGANKAFFGTQNPAMIINKIKLDGAQDLQLTFGAAYSKYNETDKTYDNEFKPEKFHLSLSADGTNWKTVEYTYAQADQYWVFATSKFKLKNKATYLYVKYAVDEESVFAIDDVTLATGSGGAEIDLGGSDEPDPTPGDVIYNETCGTVDVSAKPLISNYTGWAKTGSGAGEVSYTGEGKMSIRTTGKPSAGYNGASGANKVFFGTTGPVFYINKITIGTAQDLQLTFGAAYSKYNETDKTYDNEFKPEKFHLSLSADGTNWKTVEYTYTQADQYWVFATSKFKLKQATNYLYVKFAVDEESVFAIDDMTLSTGQGGTEIDLGGSTPAEPTLSVNPTSLSFAAKDSAKTIACTPGNADGYTVGATSSDPTNFPAAASGMTVTVTPTENTGSSARNATITVYLTNDGGATKVATKTVPVSQAAAGGTEPSDPSHIVLDFTRGVDMATPAFTYHDKDVSAFDTEGTYTIDGYTYKIKAEKFYWFYNNYNAGSEYEAFYIGTIGAYIELPAISGKALTKVILTGASGASGDCEASVTDTNGSDISGGLTQVVGQGVATYELSGTAANTSYRITITKKNCQFAKIELFYGDGSSTPTQPTLSVNPTSLSFLATDAAKTIACTPGNADGYTVGATSSDPTNFPAVVSGTTVTVTPTANTGSARSATITVYLTNDGGTTQVATKTVPVSQAAAGGQPSGGTYDKITTIAGLADGMTGFIGGEPGSTYGLQLVNDMATYGQAFTDKYTYDETTKTLTQAGEYPAVEFTLEAVNGGYNIKVGNQYLTGTVVLDSNKPKQALAFSNAPANPWVFEDYGNGIVAKTDASNEIGTFNGMYMMLAKTATSRFIRAYQSLNATSGAGFWFFKKN